MILEEKISFFEESLALEFKEWLATFGCKAKINTKYDCFTEDVISGSTDAIDKWCSEMSTEDEEHDSEYLILQQKNAEIKRAVQVVLEGRSVGDVLYTNSDRTISDAKILSTLLQRPALEHQDLSSERFYDEIFTKIPLSYIHMLFEDTNCISEDGDDTILTRDVTPGEVINELSIDRLDLSDRVEYPGLCNKFCYIPNIRYEVIFSLPSHILLDNRTFVTKLEELDVDRKDITVFIDTFSIKSQIVKEILAIIEENTVLSVEELKDKLREVHLPGWDEWGYSFLAIDIPVTRQFVFELRKAGYITGNDQKLRIPSKSGKRRKR